MRKAVWVDNTPNVYDFEADYPIFLALTLAAFFFFKLHFMYFYFHHILPVCLINVYIFA